MGFKDLLCEWPEFNIFNIQLNIVLCHTGHYFILHHTKIIIWYHVFWCKNRINELYWVLHQPYFWIVCFGIQTFPLFTIATAQHVSWHSDQKESCGVLWFEFPKFNFDYVQMHYCNVSVRYTKKIYLYKVNSLWMSFRIILTLCRLKHDFLLQ